MKKVGWIPIGDRNTPSTRIMCLNVSDWMNKNGIESDIIGSDLTRLGLVDTVIFQKIFDGPYQELAKDMKKRGKEVIYIIDDLYPEGIPMAKIADKVVCGSEYIKNWISKYTDAKLYVINDAYETPRDFFKPVHPRNEAHPLRAVWIGTLLHFPQAEELRPVIEGEGYEYVTISATPQATKRWSLETVWTDWIDSDIMVIPYLGRLPDYEMAKGNNRLTQSMVLGVPVITSPIPAYIPIIRQGKNGFICFNNTKEEFALYLRMLKNHDLRIKMSHQARKDVIDAYSIDAVGNKWKEILEDKIEIESDKKKIILYFPPVSYLTELDKGYHRFPYAVWSLVPGLEKAGYGVQVIDGRVDDKDALFRAVASRRRPLFVGISSLTGAQLLDATKTAKKVKEINREIPIVWGGWHATLMPEDCANQPFIDIVVSGRGEEAVVRVADALAKGEKVEKIVRAELKEVFPPSGLDRVDINKYGPMFGYLTSTGCAWHCTFCAIQQVYHGKMFFKPMDQVISELQYIVNNYKGLRQINIDDDLFFIKKDRVIEFCDRWNNYGGVPMSVLAHTNIMVSYDDEMWRRIVKAGFRHILIGAESGNQVILNRLKKHQTPEKMLKFVEMTAKYDLTPELSCMTGFPDSEELNDFKDTIMFLKEAGLRNPKTVFKLFYCRPFPGTELYKEFLEKGHYMPRKMSEWADYTLRHAPNWVSRELEDKVNFFTYQFFPQVGWNYTWEEFIMNFEQVRARGKIIGPQGL